MLLTRVHTDMVFIPLWLRRDSMCTRWLCSHIVEGKNMSVLGSLYCGDLGLEADEGSVRPVTEQFEVLKQLVAGL